MMDRSWKTKLLRRLAPVVAAAALAGCSGRSAAPAVVDTPHQPIAAADAWRVCDAAGEDLVLPQVMPAALQVAAIERQHYKPRLRRLPATDATDDRELSLLPAIDVTAALAALNEPDEPAASAPANPPPSPPLQVPAVDLSEALAAIVRQTTPEAAPPRAKQPAGAAAIVEEAPPASEVAARASAVPVAPPASNASRSRWSDHLASPPAPQIQSWPITRAPVPPPSTARAPSRLASRQWTEVHRAAPAEGLARLPEVPENRPPLQVQPASPLAGRSPAVLGPPQFVPPAPAAVSPPLPNIEEIPVRSAELAAMRAVSGRAEAMIHHAFGLARRSAHYSAKAELVEVLRMLSQALDMRDGATAHSDALARAFRALDEAGDFQPRGAGLESNLDIAMLVAGHQTPVLKDADLKNVTPLAALQKYYTYAQQQFTVAGDAQPTASASLYGLGRLQSIMNGPGVGGLNDGAPQAMVFHQSAVMIDGANYKAANELGVLLARYGQYDAAREMLIHSVRVSPQTQSWQNLANVHAHLGEHDLARKAMHEARLVASGAGGAHDADSPVRWVPAEALARSAPPSDDALISPASSRTVAPAAPESREVRGIMKFLPWTRGE